MELVIVSGYMEGLKDPFIENRLRKTVSAACIYAANEHSRARNPGYNNNMSDKKERNEFEAVQGSLMKYALKDKQRIGIVICR